MFPFGGKMGAYHIVLRKLKKLIVFTKTAWEHIISIQSQQENSEADCKVCSEFHWGSLDFHHPHICGFSLNTTESPTQHRKQKYIIHVK